MDEHDKQKTQIAHQRYPAVIVSVDGKVDTSTMDVKSAPNITIGSSWFGSPPVVIQNIDTAASIAASNASVEKTKWVR
jgi:hypothetical protein